MIYLKTFKLSDNRAKNSNIYPYNILKNKEPDVFLFEKITVLYGNNGSGKSTILNIIANKLNLIGKERNEPLLAGQKKYFEDFSQDCTFELGMYENGREITRIPAGSRFIKSEEILYEIRKIQQDNILKESMIADLVKNGKSVEKANSFLNELNGKKMIANKQFSQDRYSNGETTMKILDDIIEPDRLYLLDEPEVSLSPQNQVQLATKINEMARYLNCQFIIATHSPFMLGILDAKIYNLDTKNYAIQNWSELENVRFFYKFFNDRKDYFTN